MKLLYCIQGLYNPAGMERILTQKINYLVDLGGYEITVITTDQMGREIHFPLNDKIKVVNFDLNYEAHFRDNIILKSIKHIYKNYRYKKLLKNYINNNPADIVISMGGKEISFLGKLNINAKKILETHFSYTYTPPYLDNVKSKLLKETLIKILNIFKKMNLAGFDCVVSLSSYDKLNWDRSFNNVKVIGNFTNIKTSINNYDPHLRVISVGRLDNIKGYDLLIEAWNLVNKQCKDLKLDIFGDGAEKKHLEKLIAKYNLQDSIKLKGNCNEIEKEYLASSLFVMTSRNEGFPMAIIEAMASGLPVISFDCEYGPREIINSPDCGILVEPENIEKLAEAIIDTITNPKKLNILSQNSIVRAKELSQQNIMQKWIELFEETTK